MKFELFNNEHRDHFTNLCARRVKKLHSSKKFIFLVLATLSIYIALDIKKQIDIQNDCIEKYSFCVITALDINKYGKSFMSYKFWDNGEEETIRDRIAYLDYLKYNIHIGDTLVLFYCNGNKTITANPIIKGDFFDKNYPSRKLNKRMYEKYGFPLPDSLWRRR